MRALLAVCLIAGLAMAPACAGVRRLTNGNGGLVPQMSDAGQVVWQGLPWSGEGIYLWDGAAVRPVSEANSNSNQFPRINAAGEAVWEGYASHLNSEIFLWDGSATRMLTDTIEPQQEPAVGSSGQVVWSGLDNGRMQIYLWDGHTTRELTHDPFDHGSAQVNGRGEAVWQAGILHGAEYVPAIFRWDGSSVRQLTSGETSNNAPQINEAGQVVWEGWDDLYDTTAQIYLWNNGVTRQLTRTHLVNRFPHINNKGQVAWTGQINGSASVSVYMWDGQSIRNLQHEVTGDPSMATDSGPLLNDRGEVVWLGEDSQSSELYLWDGAAIRRITHFSEKGLKPEIAGYSINNAGQVAFSAIGEIYRYTPPVPGSVDLAPSPVVEGEPSTGVITLPAPAPPGGAVVSLMSGDPSVAVIPAAVTVPAGATTAPFPIVTHLVPAPTAATIRASYAGSTWTTALQIWHAVPASLTLDMPSAIGGLFGPTATITLDGEAPAGGVVIALASDNPAVTLPATVTIPERRTTATFGVGTRPVAADISAQISASYSGVTRTVRLRVQAPQLTSLLLQPNPVTGGAACQAGIGLRGGAPDSGLTVALQSSNPAAAAVPASALVAPGANGLWVPIITHPVGTSTQVQLSASWNGNTVTQELVVLSFGLAELILPSSPITSGQTGSGAVVLSAPAPAGGASVVLYSDASSVATVPPKIMVPAGANAGVFPIATLPVSSSTPVVIHAYFAGQNQQATLTVLP